ncbi:glycosyltransferase family 39 protein [Asticcacaulis solisilvae]|uniref:glycosyltransferase family 39 protein n=1 Tax=Asticcacaulis solisilvae TaxID=1217274 RepID=UPI003FD7CDAB
MPDAPANDIFHDRNIPETFPATASPIFTGLCGLAIATGLLFAFVQLERSSFWYDELFTGWVVRTQGLPEAWAHARMDVHPPLYYLSLHLYSRLFGDSDGALRSFSALAAAGACLVVLFGLRRDMALPARLVAAGLMVGSRYWFYMAQNARSYALCLLIGTGLVAVAARILRNDRRQGAWMAALVALGLAGTFVHYFIAFETLALAVALSPYVRRSGWVLPVGGAACVLAAWAYVKWVVTPLSVFDPNKGWMSLAPGFLADSLLDAVKDLSFLVPVLICLVAIALRTKSARRTGDFGGTFRRTSRKAPLLWICLLVPPGVLVASLMSSLLAHPNFNTQSFLVTAPFIWCAWGLAFDLATRSLSQGTAATLRLLMAVAIAAMQVVDSGRFVARNETWRESADGIMAFEACRGQDIPIVSEDGPYLKSPDLIGRYGPALFSTYLHGHARAVPVEHTDIDAAALPAPIRETLRTRLDGKGCPVLFWAPHTGQDAYADSLIAQVTALAGPPAPGYHIAARTYAFYPRVRTSQPTRNPGFFLYVEPD